MLASAHHFPKSESIRHRIGMSLAWAILNLFFRDETSTGKTVISVSVDRR